jgi:hypothetical protein
LVPKCRILGGKASRRSQGKEKGEEWGFSESTFRITIKWLASIASHQTSALQNLLHTILLNSGIAIICPGRSPGPESCSLQGAKPPSSQLCLFIPNYTIHMVLVMVLSWATSTSAWPASIIQCKLQVSHCREEGRSH